MKTKFIYYPKFALNEEIKAKFIKCILKNDNWQWFIDYVEDNYDYKEDIDWLKFLYNQPEFLKYFIQINRNTDNRLHLRFKDSLINDFWILSEYMTKKVTFNDAKSSIKHDIIKLNLVAVRIANLINKFNNTNYEIFWDLFVNTNLHKIYNLSGVKENKTEIINFVKNIKFDNIDVLIDVLSKNISSVDVHYDSKLLAGISIDNDTLVKFDIDKPNPKNLPWQENLMINLIEPKSYSDSIPCINYEELKDFNHRQRIITALKGYFGSTNINSNLFIETAEYLCEHDNKDKINVFPSNQVLSVHICLLLHALDNDERYVFRSCSARVIGYSFQDGIYNKLRSASKYSDLMKCINEQNEIDILKK